MSFIAEWLSTLGTEAGRQQAEYDTEAEAQARADDLVRRGHHWVVVFEVGEASA